MAGDWDQLLQSIVIGLIFSFLLAKLISILVSFKEDNLHITRDPSSSSSADAAVSEPLKPQPPAEQPRPADADSVAAEVGSVRDDGASDSDDDDSDWEGVETTELDEMFSAATAFVAATAAEKVKVPTEVQLQLYGLYKIATEGPCTSPQPSALKMTARAKWQAWQKLGAMPPEEAMQKYIEIVTELYPSWISGSCKKGKDGSEIAQSSDSRGLMGPVFSSFVYEEESGTELKMDAIHDLAREGEVDNLSKCIDSGVAVNVKDSEGRTPLHWAVDRGHLDVVELLLSRNADVNAKDDEGQTPLHYAAVCEREDIAEYLVKNHADVTLKDNDGSSPCDICEANWPWMQPESKQIS